MFDAFPMTRPLPLQQSDAYARALATLGLETETLRFAEVGRALMQVRRLPVLGALGLVSRGPVWTGVPDTGALAAVLRDRGHPVLINADWATAQSLRSLGLIKMMTAATVAELDLTQGAAALRARMHQKWRNRLAAAENAPIKVERAVFSEDSGYWLLAAEAAQRKARGYRGYPPAFAIAYAQANRNDAQLFTARLKGRRVAGMLFLRHGAGATYFIGHTGSEGRRFHAHNLLLARAAEWLAENGVVTLDLGMIDTEQAPGLARFKLGSGAYPRLLGGTWLHSRWLSPVLGRMRGAA